MQEAYNNINMAIKNNPSFKDAYTNRQFIDINNIKHPDAFYFDYFNINSHTTAMRIIPQYNELCPFNISNKLMNI